jgi:hypothetical protein
MKKITLTIAFALGLVLASFTGNNSGIKSAVLDDIDGTLLKTPAVIENNNGAVTVTFDVDKNVMVSKALIGDSNEIFLFENGNANESKTVTLDLQTVDGKVATSFNNIYQSNYDVATMEGLSVALVPDKKPSGIIIWD